jgi:hypothetical protein
LLAEEKTIKGVLIVIKKGEWVLIHRVVLKPEERAPQVPDDTKKVPLELWVKGYLQEDANIGDEVTVLTRTKRLERGTLVEANPYYKHDFGKFVPELLKISEQVKEIVFGGADNE